MKTYFIKTKMILGSIMLLLCWCPKLQGQPLYKRNKGTMCNNFIMLFDTIEYKKEKYLIMYNGDFYPKWTRESPHKPKMYFRLSELATVGCQESAFETYKPEWLELDIHVKRIKGDGISSPKYRMNIVDGKAKLKKTFLIKDDEKPFYATVDFRLDLINLKKNYAKTTIHTKVKKNTLIDWW